MLDFRRGHIVQRFGGRFGAPKQSVSCLAFDPDGLLALSGALDSSVRLWDIESG
jgi:WD40 repeat protein